MYLVATCSNKWSIPLLVLWSAVAAADGVQFVAPVDGQVVHPGETVPFVISVEPGLNLSRVLVVPDGKSGLTIQALTTAPYEGTVKIPRDYVGPFRLLLSAFGVSDPTVTLAGDKVTVNVVLDVTPVGMTVSTESITILLPQSANSDNRRIYATGIYADGVDRELRGTLTGTTYTSSDVNVATVDASGVVNAVASGRAFVTIQSGVASGFVEVNVRDPNSPIMPIAEHTTSVAINASGFRPDPETGEVVQQLLIQNTSTIPLSNPLVLVVTALPQSVVVSNAATTKAILPVGTPYVSVEVPIDSEGRGHWFMLPGVTATATLVFRNPQGIPITYTPRLYTAERP